MTDEKENAIDIDAENPASHEEHTIDFEPEDELGSVGAALAKLKKVKEELTATQKEKNDNLDGWQRAKADLANYRREAAQATDRAIARTKEGIIEDIIPVLDSFDLAMAGTAWESVDSLWRAGVEQIRNQLINVLKIYQVERFGASGDMLDHNLHEAVQEVDEGEGASHSIVRVLRYGYRTPQRVLRPAQVIVKK